MIEKIKKINIIIFIVSLFLIFVNPVLGNKDDTQRIIKDMLGREIEIAKNITRVIGTSPTTTLPIYMMTPEKLGAWNFDFREDELPFIPEKYRSLPVIGGWFGKQDGNYEKFIT